MASPSIEQFPYSDLRDWGGPDQLDRYSRAPDTDESGPKCCTPSAPKGTLRLTVSDDDGVDVDLHLLNGPTAMIVDPTTVRLKWIEPGVYWISIDTMECLSFPDRTFCPAASRAVSAILRPRETDVAENDDASEDAPHSPPNDMNGPPGTAVPLNEVQACSASGGLKLGMSWLWGMVGILWWRRSSQNSAK